MPRGKIDRQKQKEKLRREMQEFLDSLDVRDPSVSKSHIRSIVLSPTVREEIFFSIPFTKFLSKNSMFGYTRHRKYIKTEVKNVRKALTLFICEQVSHLKFSKEKVWIDIIVVKPNERFDAANFVDGIFDCIKEAIEIDDNVFSIRRLDWAVNPEMPEIIIGISSDGVNKSVNPMSFSELRKKYAK